VASVLGGLLSSATAEGSLCLICTWDEKTPLSSKEKALLEQGKLVNHIFLPETSKDLTTDLGLIKRLPSRTAIKGGDFHLDLFDSRAPEKWDLETKHRELGKYHNFGTPYGLSNSTLYNQHIQNDPFRREYQGTFSEEIPDDSLNSARYASLGIRARRVRVPEFELFSNPQISLQAIRERRFDSLVDIAQRVPETLTEMIERGLKERRYFIRMDRFSRILQGLTKGLG
jgi:hypothetical protein